MLHDFQKVSEQLVNSGLTAQATHTIGLRQHRVLQALSMSSIGWGLDSRQQEKWIFIQLVSAFAREAKRREEETTQQRKREKNIKTDTK
jgi:hypothetical protein